jgi:hypothetical protein
MGIWEFSGYLEVVVGQQCMRRKGKERNGGEWEDRKKKERKEGELTRGRMNGIFLLGVKNGVFRNK